MDNLALRAGLALALATPWSSARVAAEDSPNHDAHCDAPFEGSALRTGENDTSEARWYGVSTSRKRAGVIAVWNQSEVAVSRDDGRTFQRLEATFQDVDDVVVGASGTVFVLEGHTIHIQTAHARRLRSIRVPQRNDDEGRLAVGRGYLAYASRTGLALTKDYGASWIVKHLPDDGANLVELSIAADGTLAALLTHYNCHSGDYYLFYLGSLAGPWKEVEGNVAWLNRNEGYDWRMEDDIGRIYRVNGRGQERLIYEISPATSLWPASMVQHEHGAYARFGERLFRLTHDKAELLAQDVPEDFELTAVDGCQRLLGLMNARLVRWSPAAGFRQLDIISD